MTSLSKHFTQLPHLLRYHSPNFFHLRIEICMQHQGNKCKKGNDSPSTLYYIYKMVASSFLFFMSCWQIDNYFLSDYRNINCMSQMQSFFVRERTILQRNAGYDSTKMKNFSHNPTAFLCVFLRCATIFIFLFLFLSHFLNFARIPAFLFSGNHFLFLLQWYYGMIVPPPQICPSPGGSLRDTVYIRKFRFLSILFRLERRSLFFHFHCPFSK